MTQSVTINNKNLFTDGLISLNVTFIKNTLTVITCIAKENQRIFLENPVGNSKCNK